ncbi:MAG: MBL fold metallo-hydrolase [Treponema sp.]|jgi:glyoxylase-like metal-dependent hydrolase (beta-lactamase superfamily II)|nr:MBL fold metallo-hydrolase [Treponema sp.]
MDKQNITHLTVGAISTNCWIYRFGEKDAAVIDPGDEAERIISALNELSLVPKFILLTHGHFDHICAVPELAKVYKTENPQIAIHSLDAQYLGPDAYIAHRDSIKAAMGDTSFIDALWRDMPAPDILLKEGSEIGPFAVIHLPGHTKGSAAFWDKKEGVLFTGDTLFAGGVGRTDLPGGDEKDMILSLRRLFAMDAKISVYPGHGDTTTIGQERRG